MNKIAKAIAAITATAVIATTTILSSANGSGDTNINVAPVQNRYNSYGHSWDSNSARSYYNALTKNNLYADGTADGIFWEGKEGVDITVTNMTNPGSAQILAYINESQNSLKWWEVCNQIQSVRDKKGNPIITQVWSDKYNAMYIGDYSNVAKINSWAKNYDFKGDYALAAYSSYQFLSDYVDIVSYKLNPKGNNGMGSIEIVVDVKGSWVGQTVTAGDTTITGSSNFDDVHAATAPGCPYHYAETLSWDARGASYKGSIFNIGDSYLELNPYEITVTRYTFEVSLGRNKLGQNAFTYDVPVYFNFAGFDDEQACSMNLSFNITKNKTIQRASVKYNY